MSGAFSGLIFDGGTFDIGTPIVTFSGGVSIHKTAGGWSSNPVPQSTWAPNDLARGTQWNGKAKGPSTW